jgi:hypothetical protein
MNNDNSFGGNGNGDSGKAAFAVAVPAIIEAIKPIKNVRDSVSLLCWIGATLAIHHAPDVQDALEAVADSVGLAIEQSGDDALEQLTAAANRASWTPENN